MKGKKCIIIGAGGAGRAAAYGLHKKGVEVTFVNRTYTKAKKAAKLIGCNCTEFDKLEEQIRKSEIIISSLSQEINLVKKRWLRSDHIVFDANYKGSKLAVIAKEKGCTVVSAEDWLLNQAVKSYEHFLGDEAGYRNNEDRELFRSSLSENRKSISLTGLTGAGKTSLGKILSEKLNYSFKDIDSMIESKKGMTISEIFETKGEAYFRKLETEELKKIFDSKTRKVISCGGGIVINEKNRKLLQGQFSGSMALCFAGNNLQTYRLRQ